MLKGVHVRIARRGLGVHRAHGGGRVPQAVHQSELQGHEHQKQAHASEHDARACDARACKGVRQMSVEYYRRYRRFVELQGVTTISGKYNEDFIKGATADNETQA